MLVYHLDILMKYFHNDSFDHLLKLNIEFDDLFRRQFLVEHVGIHKDKGKDFGVRQNRSV